MFASNRLSTVQELCTRVIWLEHGRVAADGPAEQVIEAFMDADKTGGDAEEDENGAAAPPATALPAMNGPSAAEPQPQPPLSEGEIERQKMAEWVARWAEDSLLLQEELEQRRTEHHAPDVSEPSSATAAAAIQPEGLADGSVPVPEWVGLAAQASEQRERLERKWVARQTKRGRMLLSIDKKRPSLPGLGALEVLCFKFAGSEAKADKSSLELALKVDKPGTEVSVLVDGVHDQTHVFTSELPVPFIAPRSGTYLLTLEIDDALLRPRTTERDHAKSRLRIRAYLRPVGSDGWELLHVNVRFILQGEQWTPLLPYPPGYAGPMLKPILDWKVQMSPDDSNGSDAARQSMAVPVVEARIAQTSE